MSRETILVDIDALENREGDIRKQLSDIAQSMTDPKLTEYADHLHQSPETIIFKTAPLRYGNIPAHLLSAPAYHWPTLIAICDIEPSASLIMDLRETQKAILEKQVQLRGFPTIRLY